METLAAQDPETLAFEAAVDRVDGTEVWLDHTYFYPEGGGQPPDRGRIAGQDVVDVQARDGAIVHRLASEPAFSPGATVGAAVDADFRRYCRRAHTASHVLYGAGRRVLADLGYGGFDIGEEKVRVDLATPTDIDDEALVELERLTNRAVWESRAVEWETVDRDTALAREDVAFNTATEEGIEGDTVRIVTVEDWDVAACGGTHVSNTREIGPVAVLDRSNPGEGLTRVEFAVGPPAIRRQTTIHGEARAAARRLDTGVDALTAGVDRLTEERDALRAERDDLQRALVDGRLADLRESTTEREGREWLVGAVPGLDANELADRARAEADEAADVVTLVDETGAYVAVASDTDVDAGAVVEDVTDRFGGGGGGSAAAAQGGGLDATADEIVEFLETRYSTGTSDQLS